MKRLTILIIMLVCFLSFDQPLTGQSEKLPKYHAVPPQFFQMEAHWMQPWPEIPFGGLRLWDTGTTWAMLNPSDGVYDWTNLDKWLSAVQQHGGSYTFLYTMAMTPQWASSNPEDPICHKGPGQCDPPNDLNPDGSGTDQHWKDFVRAIATHAAGNIRYWEIWNEPVNNYYWSGTFAQMARLASDARTIILSIDPEAKLLSPPNGALEEFGQKWWKGYAAAGGLDYADIIALHGGVNTSPHYCGNWPKAADFITQVANLRTILASFNQHKFIWDTEASWGHADDDCFTDQDLQAAFLAQFYMFHRSTRIVRFFWYSYSDGDTGELFDGKTLTKGGVAYQQVYNWMLGKTLTKPCSANGTVWTCSFVAPNGYVGEAVWDTAQSCDHGTCQTEQYSVGKVYTQYRTLSGETIAITNGQVPIGAKPIMVEN
jgi:polysaccharide biosynthesis protein PslG